MSFFSRFKPRAVAPVVPIQVNPVVAENEKGTFGRQPSVTAHEDNESDDDDVVHKDAQAGVQKAEAMNQVWGKKTVIMIYVMYGCTTSIMSYEHTDH